MIQVQTFVYIKSSSDVRCYNCGALLAKKTNILQGCVEIKCHKCNALNNIRFDIIEQSMV